jgi:hypothetical protein
VDHLRPITAPSQVIHGDLTGNVLFDDELPPAVIDLSPYFRPPAFASAVVVADALVWEGADASLLDALDRDGALPQYLLRALIYRVAAFTGASGLDRRGAVPSRFTVVAGLMTSGRAGPGVVSACHKLRLRA